MRPPPPRWFRVLLALSGLGMLGYQRLLPEPVATLLASPLAVALSGRPVGTAPDGDAVLEAVVPLVVAGLLGWTAARRGWGAILWRATAGLLGSVLCLIWFAFVMPNLLPTSLLLLGGASLAVLGGRRERVDAGGMAAVALAVVATATAHFFVPLSGLRQGGEHLGPLLGGAGAAALLFGAMRRRPFWWHGPPRLARWFAAACAFGTVAPILGYFDVDEEAYGCTRPDPARCPYDAPGLRWLERDTDAVYYGVHLDPPGRQAVAFARARYCEDGTTAQAAFFDLDSGQRTALVDIPDCDRAYDAGRPDPDTLLPVCASGLQRLDLRGRALTTPPLERYTDFEAETTMPRPDGSWWVSGVDKAVIARFDPDTLQETERFWMADNVHLGTRLVALDFIEPGLFLFTSSTSVQVLGADFSLRARRETLGVNVFAAVDPGRRRLYLPDGARNLLRVWTLPDLKPVAQVPVPAGAYVAFLSSELGLLGLSQFSGSTVSLFDLDSIEQVGSIEVGPGPRGGAFDVRDRRLIGASRCGVYSAALPARTGSGGG